VSRGEGRLDVIVHDRFLQDVSAGVFVDVGAARPGFLSMSAYYRALGWRVIAIEPNPVFCQEHRKAGLEVLEFACADRDANDVPFEIVDSHGAPYASGAVSFESFSALRVKDAYRASATGDLDVQVIRVNVRRLDTLLAEYAPDIDRVHAVSIDVEGWELDVLRGFSLERYRPRVLIVENVFADDGYRQALKSRGYRLWRHVAPNDVYVP
jgi:FkbM family methyltransferase